MTKPRPGAKRTGGPKQRPAIERFMSKFECDPNSGCWLWSAGLGSHGYGQFSLGTVADGAMPAHRFSYQHHVGPIPDGMQVCHHCDTPACVNPDHLFLGTQLDNMRDMHEKGRWTGDNRGEGNGQSKLTEDDVRAIRASTESGAALGRHFGVNTSAIEHIRHRRRWAHVT